MRLLLNTFTDFKHYLAPIFFFYKTLSIIFLIILTPNNQIQKELQPTIGKSTLAI